MDKIRKITKRPEIFVYAYFFLFTLFLAGAIKLGVAPDETHHYNFVKYYAGHSIDPFLPQQNSDFQLGAINSEVSYLYHYLMSFVYRLADAVGLDTVVSVRVANILLGLGTLVSLNYIGQALKLTRKVRLALLFLIANIPMFMFISASISYDNLVILLTVLGVAATLSLKARFSWPKLLGVSAIAFLGPIVKMAFLPISVVFGVFVIYCLYKNREAAKKQTVILYKNNLPRFVLYTVILLIPPLMFSAKYISNMASYGALEPKCNRILTHEQCLNNPIYSRTQTYEASQAVRREPVSLDQYAVSWVKLMAGRTYGLFGHKKFEEIPAIAALILITTYSFIILFFRKISLRSFRSTIIPILFIIYIGTLVYTNHKSYASRGDIALAVQGRYAFPVLFPLILFVAHLYNRTLNKKTYQYGLIGFVIILAIVAGPLYIFQGINPSWLN